MEVVADGDADKNPGIAGQCSRGDGGLFQRFPHHLQQQALLWVQHDRFARCNAKEGSIKLIDSCQKTTQAAVGFAGGVGLPIIIGIGIPTVSGHGANGIDAIAQQLPEGVDGFSAGDAASHPHDGDGFSLGCFIGVEFCFQRSNALGCLAH